MNEIAELAAHLASWQALGGFFGVIALFGFLPGFTLRWLVKLYPARHVRRRQLVADMYELPRHKRWFFVAEQLETVLFEGLPARLGHGLAPGRRWLAAGVTLVAAATALTLTMGGTDDAPTLTGLNPANATRTLTALNSANGARLAVTLTPNPGWVGLDALLSNLPANEHYMLIVTDRQNNRFVVGSWEVREVPAPGQGNNDYTVNAGAAVTLPDVATVTVESFDNQTVVAANA